MWGDFILSATQLINLLPSAVGEWETPDKRVMDKKLQYEHMRVIGSLCYASGPRKPTDKFDERGIRCVMIGYPYCQKGYKLYDLGRKRIFLSRDVTFQENVFPFLTNQKKGQYVDVIRISMPLLNDTGDEENNRSTEVTDNSSTDLSEQCELIEDDVVEPINEASDISTEGADVRKSIR